MKAGPNRQLRTVRCHFGRARTVGDVPTKQKEWNRTCPWSNGRRIERDIALVPTADRDVVEERARFAGRPDIAVNLEPTSKLCEKVWEYAGLIPPSK